MNRSLLLFSIILLLFVSHDILGQRTQVTLLKRERHFKYEYQVLKSDTSVRHGLYKFYYKNKILEKGYYSKNEQVGLWRYYNMDGIFEFEYDFTKQKITRLSGRRDPEMETPCLFQGSPLIPYLFIVQHVNYPSDAYELDISGKVVLVLKVNKEGEVWAFYLSEKLHKSFDTEVMRVAKKFPSDWKWLPATKFGNPVESEYIITVEFELVSNL